MRPVEIIQLIATMGGAVATFIGAMEHRAIGLLKKAGALTPGTAIEAPPMNRVMRWRMRSLVQRSVVCTTGEGRIYLDEERRSMIQAARRKRVLTIVLPIVLLMILLIVWLH